MKIVVVQHLQFHWTKLSRGGEGARVRSRLPERLPLPDLPRQGGMVLRVVVQDVCFDESTGFEPHALRDDLPGRTGDRLSLGLIELVLGAATLEVDYHYQTSLGGPHRAAECRPAFTLAAGDWGLLTTNGRRTTDRGWLYSRHVFHIALLKETGMPADLRHPPRRPTVSFDDEHLLA